MVRQSFYSRYYFILRFIICFVWNAVNEMDRRHYANRWALFYYRLDIIGDCCCKEKLEIIDHPVQGDQCTVIILNRKMDIDIFHSLLHIF